MDKTMLKDDQLEELVEENKQDEVKWTDEQEIAIFDQGNNMLVSASAGSGKTTVMIQRIVETMLKEEIPVTNFLVVTFTKASATDMKNKLIKKLSEHSDNSFALSQIEEVGISDISNLHSFCSRLISTYFYEAEVDPSYHIIDEVEGAYLKGHALSILFERKQEEGNGDFFKLFDIFQVKRSDDALRKNIINFNDFLNSNLPGTFLEALEKSHEQDLTQNVCVDLINRYVSNSIQKDAEKAEKFANRCLEFGQEKMYQRFIDVLASLRSVKKSNPYLVNAKNVEEISFPRTPAPSKDFAFLSAEAKLVNEELSKNLTNYKKNFVSSNQEVLIEGIKETKNTLLALYGLVQDFNEIYSKLKKDVNGLDFNDLEKYALKILENDEILAAVKAKYAYVFVDEYQDINAVQEKIISLISGVKNRFMVGDVKQSIYRFRHCDPEIFLQKYADYDSGKPNCKLVKLNCNFRSDKKILKFVDEVFSGVMTEEFGGLNYASESCFVPGKKNVDNPNSVNLCFIDTHTEKVAKNKANGVYSVKEHEQLETEESETAIAEARFVADKISDLVNPAGEFKWDYSDIAILVGKRNEAVSKFVQTLKAIGIPVSSDEKNNLLEKDYIQELVCFVKFLCNQKNDYLLFKVLKSRLFGFSNEELVELRLIDKKVRFFSLLDYAESLENEDLKNKIFDFNQKIEKYKKLAKLLSLKELLKKIIDDFSIFKINLTEQNGAIVNSEIDKFVEALPDVDAFEFVLNYEDFSLNLENESGGDTVKLMTIHKSKGMEFKAVFLINMASKFNLMSTNDNIMFSKMFGAGMNYFDVVARTQMSSVPISAIKLLEKRKLVEEQQRILYVALTRAKEKLFVVCSKDKDSLLNEFPERPSCYCDWFDSFILKELDGKHNEIINFEEFSKFDLLAVPSIEKKDLMFYDEKIISPDWFEYGFKKESKIPLKSSISKMLKTESPEEENEEKRFEQSESISFADRGTVYHKVFERFDFKNMQDIQKQLRKIIEELDEKEKSLVDEMLVSKTLQLPLFSAIANADKILKEREFYAKMPAGMIDKTLQSDDEFVLQGVVDLIAIFGNEMWILDYKTGKCDDERLKKYAFQIETYAKVCEKAFGRRVTKKLICFVDLQKITEI